MSILWLKIKVTSNLFHCHLVTFLLQLVGEKPWGHEAWALQFLQTPLYKYLTSKIKREWESYFYVPESNFWSRKIFFSLDGDNLLCLIEGLYIPPRVLNFVELLAFENIDSRDCLKHELVFTINREASRPPIARVQRPNQHSGKGNDNLYYPHSKNIFSDTSSVLLGWVEGSWGKQMHQVPLNCTSNVTLSLFQH